MSQAQRSNRLSSSLPAPARLLLPGVGDAGAAAERFSPLRAGRSAPVLTREQQRGPAAHLAWVFWVGRRLAVVALTMLALGRPAHAVAPPADATPAPADGAALYARYCALCHGARGQGYAADHANALANQQFLVAASDPFLGWAIAYGRPGTPMAAFGKDRGGPLDHGQISKLITFIRSWQQSPPIALKEGLIRGEPARGERLYAAQCAGCHGVRGKGKTAPSLNNPVLLATASDSYLRYAIAEGRAGTPMPAFKGKLSGDKLDDLTAYLRSLYRKLEWKTVPEAPPPITQIVINPKGGPPRFPPLREGLFVPVDTVKAELTRGARLVLLDARPTSDWMLAHIPGALPVPYYDVDKMVSSLPRDDTFIVAYCSCPHAASGQVVSELRRRGFKNTAVLDEGIFVWMERGYPVTTGSGETVPAPTPAPAH